MKNRRLFYFLVTIAIITIILGIYYAIPGIYHPFVYFEHPLIYIHNPLVNNNAHRKYTALFFVIASICLGLAYLVRRRKQAIY
jgi:hypothetical protein